MTNIHDWCISRQLWWGHRIPAWYCDTCGEMIVAEDTPAACACGGPLRQETDVLDTWFSSGLWPFSTLGWPDDTDDLRHYYPTDLLVTGFDIIFFWVARMIMLGLRFAGDVPFRDVYITALVRDAQGQKMSKSKGNVVDPLQLMDEIGADALRFTLAAMASPGMDIALSEGRLTGYRQFINKIWNASRFLLMNLGDDPARLPVPAFEGLALIHRWILHRVSVLARELEAALTEYRFDVAAHQVYHFFWHEYADWYIEMVKPHLQATGAERDEAIAVLLDVHDRVLRMLHPFIPFVTEEIWQTIPKRRDDGLARDGVHQTIARATFPTYEAGWIDERAAAAMTLIQDVTTAIRTARAERGVPPSRKLTALIDGAAPDDRQILTDGAAYIKRLAGLDELTLVERVPRSPDTVRQVVGRLQVHIPLAGIVDREAEQERIRRELARLDKQLTGVQAKLANPDFRERADPEVVEETTRQHHELGEQREKLTRILAELVG
jgi:valyl-tRNA synthetase